jgi:hypothetical protein
METILENYIRSIWPNVRDTLEARDLLDEAHDLSHRGQLAVHYSSHGLKVAQFHSVTEGSCTCRESRDCSSPGKHARSKGWIESATTDPEIITDRWLKYPDANIAIVPGTTS